MAAKRMDDGEVDIYEEAWDKYTDQTEDVATGHHRT